MIPTRWPTPIRPALVKWEQEDHKSKISLSYIMSSGSSWDIREPVSKGEVGLWGEGSREEDKGRNERRKGGRKGERKAPKTRKLVNSVDCYRDGTGDRVWNYTLNVCKLLEH